MTLRRARTEFEALLVLAPTEREPRLAALAAADPQLAAAVRELLRHDAEAAGFLERAALPPPGAAAVGAGQRFGRFELVRPLGSGGMGSVWEAVQHDPRRRVALKLLTGGVRSDAERWRFQHEVQVLAALNHPAIATFFEAGTADAGGVPVDWLAMELVDGACDVLTFADRQQLARPARLALFGQLCEAVAYGHRRGVLHRDLKPGNVLVGRDGALKLIDFGISRALAREATPADHTHAERTLVERTLVERTHTGDVVGTLQYMAPEQLRGGGHGLGTAVDVYALGVILYHLLCGRAPLPLAGKSLTEVARLVLEQEPVPPLRVRPDLPADLGWIVLRALAKDPQRRYPTVDALVDDLERCRRHLPVAARAPSLGYRVTKFVRRHRVGAAIGAAVVFGLAFGGYGLWRGAADARQGEQLARTAQADAEAARRLAEAAQQQAAQRERAAVRADEQSRELLRVTVGLFDGIEDTVASRDLKVHELLDAAPIDERTTADPAVELAVRELRGSAYERLHRFPEARREYERALVLVDQLSAQPTGDDNLTQPAQRHGLLASLGRTLVHTGERERGERLLREAVAATVGAPPSVRRRALSAWCHHLVENNEHTALRTAAPELLALASTGPSSLEPLFVEDWMARAATALGLHDEAVATSARALASARTRCGDSSRVTCTMLSTHVSALHTAGQLDAAEALYPELIASTRSLFGASHPNLLATLNNRVHLAMQRGQRTEAIAGMRAIVEAYEAGGGAVTVEHLTALHNLGMVLNLGGRFDEAEPLLRRSADLSRSLLGPRDHDGAMMRFNHGACLAWMKRFDAAEPVLLAEYALLGELLPADHAVLGKARRTIADAYRVNGKPEQAAAWRTK